MGARDMPLERIVTLERDIVHIRKDMDADRNLFMRAIEETKNHIDEKIDDVVRQQAKSEFDLGNALNKQESHVKELNGRVGLTNETLQQINTRLAIHNFILLVIAAVGTWIGGAFFKSVFDAWLSSG